MITTAQTLVSLACLISNKGELDTTAIENQLSLDEMSQIQQVIDSKACLPENLEILLQKTKASGLSNSIPSHAPTDSCFAKSNSKATSR